MRNWKVLLVLLVVASSLMTACNFTTNFSDDTGKVKMEAYAQVEDMLTALSENDRQASFALMHPDYTSKLETAYKDLNVFLDGREVRQMTQESVSRQTSNGTDGKVQQETGTFSVLLEDGTQFYLTVSYLAESGKKGFTSFQLVLGVV